MGTWADFYAKVCGEVRLLEGNIMEHSPLIEELAKYVQVGSRVLEVGSGTGVLAWPLAQAGVKVVSLDNDQEILDMAKVNAKLLGSDIEYVFGDAFELPYGEGEFELVFSEGLLEHYSDEEIGKIVAEHRRVGRMAVVGVPLKGCAEGTFGDERWMTKDEWANRLEPMGLVRMFTYHSGERGCFTLLGVVAARVR